jgi:hypothetical protein
MDVGVGKPAILISGATNDANRVGTRDKERPSALNPADVLAQRSNSCRVFRSTISVQIVFRVDHFDRRALR